jgi:hypothetical protein
MKQNIRKINKVFEVLSIVLITFVYFSNEISEVLGIIQIAVSAALVVAGSISLCRFGLFFGIKNTFKII